MKKLNEFFDETGRFIFVSSVIVMILAHGFCFMNLMYSHDSLTFVYTCGPFKVSLGRWFYPFLESRRLFATPWFMGISSILYVSMAVLLVAKLFNFNKVQGICVAILFGSNVTLTSLFCTYIFDADVDCFAIFLACFAVFSFKKFPKVINIIVPIFSLTLSLALYQSYICLAAGLYIALLIQESSKSNSWKDVLSVFLCGVKELFTLASGTILYVFLTHIASKHYGVELLTSFNSAGSLSSLKVSDMIENIPKAYEYFKDTFFGITEYNTLTIVRVNYVIALFLAASVVVYIIKHKKFLGSLIIVLPAILIMPLALNAIYLATSGVIHQLMIFSFCIVYLLPLIIINTQDINVFQDEPLNKYAEYIKKLICGVTIVATMVIGFNNIVYANGAYVYKKLVYDNTQLHAQTIWKDINSIDGYIEGETQVVFMGEFPKSNAAYNSPVATRYYDQLTGASNSSITYNGTEYQFYYGILGRNLNITYNDATISEAKEYADMPIYPSNGYCKMIDDRVVVKLSN